MSSPGYIHRRSCPLHPLSSALVRRPEDCTCQGLPELGEIVDIKAKLPWGDLLSIPAKVTRIVDGVPFAVSLPRHPGGPIYFIGEQPLLRGLAWSRRDKP